MKATEVRDIILNIDKQLYELSDIISKPIEFDGIDVTYLAGKIKSMNNTSKHILDQIKHRSE